ncbi:endonuclease/exonuclease/phosphatase family protein [Sessilibacter sp. MAH1]
MANSQLFKWLSFLIFCICSAMTYADENSASSVIRIATFNVSMEATNYTDEKLDDESNDILTKELLSGKNSQIKNIAEIIQRVRPNIILLNEFDYIQNPSRGVLAFIDQYLKLAQQSELSGIDYPYFFTAPVNTGEPSPYDFNRDGIASGKGEDAWGYGNYPGQYGMVVLSQFPIDIESIRTFKNFRWHDMPNALAPINPDSGKPWYSAAQWQDFRLSSKSHWDLPITIQNKKIHLLAQHPTPPVFDGPENRNGLRNHDEIRLIADYLSGESYLYDDTGSREKFNGQRFVILGDLNASVYSKETYPGTMEQLLNHPKINSSFIPKSDGGKENAPDDANSDEHTAFWKSRADYVLPSKEGLEIVVGGVYWPTNDSALFRLVADRKASSDHRLVYLDLKITDN